MPFSSLERGLLRALSESTPIHVFSMDQIANELSEYLIQKFLKVPSDERFLVGISGVPASGKSTLSKLLVSKINKQINDIDGQSQTPSIVVGLDGWHLTRAQLDAFADPKLAHDRRGAHWTFDGESYLQFIRELRQPLVPSETSQPNIIYAPSFSHELKDPTPRSVRVYPHHRLVIIEGLYTFLSIAPWREAGELLDERWWVDISEEDAERRLVPRHLKSGICKDLNEAEWRARENDAPSQSLFFDDTRYQQYLHAQCRRW